MLAGTEKKEENKNDIQTKFFFLNYFSLFEWGAPSIGRVIRLVLK
mgnify:CR=1 FL=1